MAFTVELLLQLSNAYHWTWSNFALSSWLWYYLYACLS